MIHKNETKLFYLKLGFVEWGDHDFPSYLMVQRNLIQIHFFLFPELNPAENYGQIYMRTGKIKDLYAEFEQNGIEIHPQGKLELKSWGQMEFSILDPNNNLLTFGQFQD